MSGRTTDLGALRQRLALIERGGRGDDGCGRSRPAVRRRGDRQGAARRRPRAGRAARGARASARRKRRPPRAPGFLAGILARLEPGRPVLWCRAAADLHAPGLARHGLAPERLDPGPRRSSETDVLWAMEEGLKCRALAAVVGEVEALPLAGEPPAAARRRDGRRRRLRAAPPPAQPAGRRRGAADRCGDALARRAVPLAPRRRARHRPAAVAGRTAALPRRRAGALDGGGMRCGGSCSSGCRRWPIDRRQRRAAPQARRALSVARYLGRQPAPRSAPSTRPRRREGIAPGMTLADARALQPRPRRRRGRFRRRCGGAGAARRDGAAATAPGPRPCGPTAIWLDVTGCAHLHGGEAGLAGGGGGAAARHAASPPAPPSPTAAGAAWAVARFGGARIAVVPAGGARAALAPLPVAALRLAPELAATCWRGSACAASAISIPCRAPSLVLRFGAGLAARLDQALGALRRAALAAAAAAAALGAPPLRRADRHAEAIAAATRALLDALCRQLAAEGDGARRLELALYRVDGTPVAARDRHGRPSREPRHLLRLFDERLGAIDPGLGIEDMVLAATVAEAQPPLELPCRLPCSLSALGARGMGRGAGCRGTDLALPLRPMGGGLGRARRPARRRGSATRR